MVFPDVQEIIDNNTRKLKSKSKPACIERDYKYQMQLVLIHYYLIIVDYVNYIPLFQGQNDNRK